MSSTLEERLDLVDADNIDVEAVRTEFLAILKEEEAKGKSGKKIPQIAPEASIGHSTLHAWAAGKYSGDNAGVALKVIAWITKRKAGVRIQTQMRRAPGFLRTRTASELLEELEYAQMMPDMAMITGAPGIGKTTTAEFYQANGASVWIVTAQPVTETKSALLKLIARAMKLRVNRSAADLSLDIQEAMTGTRGLLIVDEANHLSDQLRDQLRSTVVDAAGIGLALIGNEAFADRFRRQKATGDYAQLVSRVGRRKNREKPYKADIELLLNGWGVIGDASREAAIGVGLLPGGLRHLSKVLRIAFSVSDARGDEEPTVADIEMVWRQLGGQG